MSVLCLLNRVTRNYNYTMLYSSRKVNLYFDRYIKGYRFSFVEKHCLHFSASAFSMATNLFLDVLNVK